MSAALLKESCGVFAKMRGTDKVIHYSKKFLKNVFLEMEASEITQMRSLRFAIESGKQAGIALDRPTFSLYFSGLVAEALRCLPGDIPIIQVGARLSPELETLKFLQSCGKLKLHQGQITCIGVSNQILPFWTALHQRMESMPFSSLAQAEVRPEGDFQWLADLSGPVLVFINAFKAAPSVAEKLVAWLKTEEACSSRSSFLIAMRCSVDASKPVVNVLREEFMLPNYGEILGDLNKAGWQTAYRLIPNLDRDYLLPFEGNYGVMVLIASRTAELAHSISTLQHYGVEAQSSRGIAVFNENQGGNYDLSLAADLPVIGEPAEPDWKRWCRNFDWNPDEIDWVKVNTR